VVYIAGVAILLLARGGTLREDAAILLSLVAVGPLW
jgi:hypothetical protein